MTLPNLIEVDPYTASVGSKSTELIARAEKYGAHIYHPLEVVIERGQGVWLWDVEGRKFLDMLSAYSAINFGHGNQRLVEVAKEQISKLAMTSRAFYSRDLCFFCEELANFCGLDVVLPMNSGAEAVETAIKAARKWGYLRKGVEKDKAEIICFSNNFGGRTTTIISFSDSEKSRADFGPFTPGFKIVPYGDVVALEAAFTKNTVAVLVEPIQGEAGIIIPPAGFLRSIRDLCNKNGAMFLADEIQTGLCRTGKIFACDHEDVKPDAYIIGKSLGGGLVPISAVIGTKELMGVFTPGTHGSTFGGNPLACRIAREVIRLIKEEKPEEKSFELGMYLLSEVGQFVGPIVEGVRGRGLFVGVDIKESVGPAREICHQLVERGVLCKDTRAKTLRLAPPLTISRIELDFGIAALKQVLTR